MKPFAARGYAQGRSGWRIGFPVRDRVESISGDVVDRGIVYLNLRFGRQSDAQRGVDVCLREGLIYAEDVLAFGRAKLVRLICEELAW